MFRMRYRHNKKSRLIPAHTYKKMQNVGKKKSSVLIQLSGWLRTLDMVGVAGLEPAASWSRTKHTTKLCHTPIAILLYKMAERLSRCGGNFCDFFKKKRSRLNRPLRFSHCYRIFGGRLIPAKSPRKAAHIRKQTIHPAFLYSCICVPP